MTLASMLNRVSSLMSAFQMTTARQSVTKTSDAGQDVFRTSGFQAKQVMMPPTAPSRRLKTSGISLAEFWPASGGQLGSESISLLDALSQGISLPLLDTVKGTLATGSRAIQEFQTAGGLAKIPEEIDKLIVQIARQYQVDPDLVRAVAKAESGFNPTAVSSAGAKGIMQLMDGTARTLGVTDSFDPVQNIQGGVKFLRALLDQFKDVRLALAAYNAGPNAVKRYQGIPPYAETQTYVRRVMDFHQQFRAANQNSGALDRRG